MVRLVCIVGMVLFIASALVSAAAESNPARYMRNALAYPATLLCIVGAILVSAGLLRTWTLPGFSRSGWECSFSGNPWTMFMVHVGLPCAVGLMVVLMWMKSQNKTYSTLFVLIWIAWAMWSANFATLGCYGIPGFSMITGAQYHVSARALHYAQIIVLCSSTILVPWIAMHITKLWYLVLALAAPMVCSVATAWLAKIFFVFFKG